MKQWTDFWLLEGVPMDASIVAEQMSRLLRALPKEAAPERLKRIDKIVRRLLEAGVTTAQTKDILKLRLTMDAKLMLLLSDLPFSSSDLVGALTRPLMSAAKACDAALVDSIVRRLLKAGVTTAQTKDILKQPLRLNNDATLKKMSFV